MAVTLTETECKLIRDRLRKHLTYCEVTVAVMTGTEYVDDVLHYDTIAGPMTGLEIKTAALKEVDDTLKALSLL